MQPRRTRGASSPLWIITTAATLLGAAGFAVLMSTSLAAASRKARPVPSVIANRAPAGSAGGEITIRLMDGSSRVIADPNPAQWRPGERVMVIDGAVGPGA